MVNMLELPACPVVLLVMLEHIRMVWAASRANLVLAGITLVQVVCQHVLLVHLDFIPKLLLLLVHLAPLVQATLIMLSLVVLHAVWAYFPM